MGYQINPLVYGTARFIPNPVTPLDVVVPSGATGLYVNWLFSNILDRFPSDLFAARLSNTVARFQLGPRGDYIGVADVSCNVAFENLGTPTLFSLTLDVGFNLNDVGQIVTGTFTTSSGASNQSPYVTLRMPSFKSRTIYQSIIAAGQSTFDVAFRITQTSGANRTIRVSDSDADYTLLERLSP